MDLVLRNGRILDGSGGPAYEGDVGVRDGRIAAVGKVGAPGREEIDVGGAVIAPGFIDVHTHYDAQVFWDPYLTPSVFHGVTTVVAGNCGFTLAPLSGKPEDADYLLRMLSRVEGMPLSTLRQGVRPDWTSFGEFLDRIDREAALNMAFMVGHSTLRRSVMGERAVGGKAKREDIEAMKTLLRASLKAGGVGFSTTVATPHQDYEGQPVPSRWADREEIVELAAVAGEFPGTWLEMVFAREIFGEDEHSLMADMSVAAGRFLNWNLLNVSSAVPQAMASQLQASDYARERGGKVLALVQAAPSKSLINFVTGFLLDTQPGWPEMLGLPHEEKKAALMDPAMRVRLAEASKNCESDLFRRKFADWGAFFMEGVRPGKNECWNGRAVRDLAEETGKAPFDALLDLVVEEDLKVSIFTAPRGTDDESWRMRARAWVDDRCVVGASDAGAHLDMIDTFAFSTQLLGEGVRRRGLLSMEEGVRRITSIPAERFGLIDRGSLAVGMHADIVVFDPETVGSGPVESRFDLPGNELRLYADAHGVHHVFVGGVTVVQDGALTGKRGGGALRSGRDTRTAPLTDRAAQAPAASLAPA